MDGIGGDNRIESPFQQPGLQRLLQPLEPPLFFQIAQVTQVDPRVVAKFFQRQAEELGRGVNQQHTGRHAGAARQETFDQDTGTARVVQQQSAGLDELRELLYRPIQVGVPGMLLHGVVFLSQLLNRPTGPGVIGSSGYAGRPIHAHNRKLAARKAFSSVRLQPGFDLSNQKSQQGDMVGTGAAAAADKVGPGFDPCAGVPGKMAGVTLAGYGERERRNCYPFPSLNNR